MIIEQEKQNQRGFLTLEILLAMAVMVLMLSAAVLASYGGQSLAADTRLSNEALVRAREMIESQRILAEKDFRLVNSTSSEADNFRERIEVESRSFFKKYVRAGVSWSIGGRDQKIELLTLMTDYGQTAGDDTCDSNLSGDWTDPQIKKVVNFADFAENSSSTYAISDVDAYKNKLYVSVGKTANKRDATFFIFDISDPFLPQLIGKIDNNPEAMAGINEITLNGNYAFAAGATSKQFQIIDIAALPPKIIFESGISDGGEGKSIFYKNGYVYLGLASAKNVPEFHIINVKNISNAIETGHWPSGGGLKHGINDIYVKGKFAYLAHPTDADGSGGCPREQLTVLDVSNAALPQRASGFYSESPFGGNGKSLYLVGDKLHFGRTASNISGNADEIPEFYIIDNLNPEKISAAVSGSLPLQTSESVDGVLARDNLVFLLKNNSFQVISAGDPANISNWGSAAIEAASGENFEPSFDCEGNIFFVGSNIGGNGRLTVITAK